MTAEHLTEFDKQHSCLHEGDAGGPTGVVAYRWAQKGTENFMPHGYYVQFATHISTGPRDRQEELYSEVYVKGLLKSCADAKAAMTSAADKLQDIEASPDSQWRVDEELQSLLLALGRMP